MLGAALCAVAVMQAQQNGAPQTETNTQQSGDAQPTSNAQKAGNAQPDSAQDGSGQKTQGQAPPSADAQRTPRGTILFERHEPSVAPEPEEAPTQPAGTQTGESSSAHPPRLRRRAPSDKATGRNAEDTNTDDASSAQAATENITGDTAAAESSSSDEGPPQQALVTVNDADRAVAAKVPAEARQAVTIASRTMDLHLNTHTGVAEVRVQMTVRNASNAPLAVIPLRISGALHWESARQMDTGETLPVEQHHIRDDLDHTGVATEIALALPKPLAPGAEAKLDLYYGGVLGESTARLLGMGAPVAVATRTDWDTVTDAFTGLRGMGNVLWYPVSGDPALLQDGSAVSRAVEASRVREAESSFHLRLTLEYAGAKPDAAFLGGERKALVSAGDETKHMPKMESADASSSSSSSDEMAANDAADGGVAMAEWKIARLGLSTPSLFVAQGAPQTVANGLLRVVTDQADRASAMGEAAARIRPLLEQWLGPQPSRVLDVIDLPIPDAAGYADGSLLVAPLRTATPEAMAPSLIGPLTNAWLPARITAAWLRDGVPAFMQLLWTERTSGRTAALAGLATEARRMQQMESTEATSSSSSSSDDTPVNDARLTPLAACSNASCSRTRAAYVFAMLRNIVGEPELQGALSGWRVAAEIKNDTAAEQTAHLETLLQQVAGTKKLDWFFANWVQGTGSLPQLAIATVAPRRIERARAQPDLVPQKQQIYGGPIGKEVQAPPDDPRAYWGGDKMAGEAGSWLVAVEVQNSGGTEAEVPVTVRTGTLTNTLNLRVPAHGKATIRVPFEAQPDEVVVNDGSVPEQRTAIHRQRVIVMPQQR